MNTASDWTEPHNERQPVTTRRVGLKMVEYLKEPRGDALRPLPRHDTVDSEGNYRVWSTPRRIRGFSDEADALVGLISPPSDSLVLDRKWRVLWQRRSTEG